MRKPYHITLFWAMTVLFGLLLFAAAPAAAQDATPTPTFDPLVEPVLPENPTELELGRHRYWLWCMTCHGDQGQGLTDDWRAEWESDHQNCWSRGCHTGRPGDAAFPIPTIVPLIIGEDHLVQFAAVDDLAAYLKLTHPPQHPGILTDEEYHAIAAYVFTMNGRDLATATPSPEPLPSATTTRPPEVAASTPAGTLPLVSDTTTAWLSWAVLAAALVSLLLYGRWFRRIRQPGK